MPALFAIAHSQGLPTFSSLALTRAGGLQEPQVKVLHIAAAGAHEFSHAGQDLLERLDLQSKLCQLRGAPVSIEP